MLARKGYQPSQAFRIVNEVLDSRQDPDNDRLQSRYP